MSYKFNPLIDGNTIREMMLRVNSLMEKLEKEFVSVRDFRAVGDGATDDTSAFQEAIDHASSIGLNLLIVPSGSYSVGDLEVPSNVKLFGTGVTWTNKSYDVTSILDTHSNIEELKDTIDDIQTELENKTKKATQAQAQAGVSVLTLMTPERTKQSIEFNAIAKKGTIPNTTDFNSVGDPGVYNIAQGGAKSENFPPLASSAYGNLIVFNSVNGADYPSQIFIGDRAGDMHFRMRYNNAWKDWTKVGSFRDIATQAQAQDGSLNSVVMTPATTSLNHVRKRLTRTNNLDLNTFVQDGEYALGTGINIGGTAISFANFGILKTITSGDVIHQTVYQFQGDVYERIFTTNDNVRPSFRITIGRAFTGVYATQSQAQAGTDNATIMTPQRTKQAINNSPINRYGVATGTNNLTITLDSIPSSTYDGMRVTFKNTTANTGNVTCTVTGLITGASVLNNDGSQIQSGKLKANAIYDMVLVGSSFYLAKGGGEGTNYPYSQDNSFNVMFGGTWNSSNDRVSFSNNLFYDVYTQYDGNAYSATLRKFNHNSVLISSLSLNSVNSINSRIMDINTIQLTINDPFSPYSRIYRHYDSNGTLKETYNQPMMFDGEGGFINSSTGAKAVITAKPGETYLSLYNTTGTALASLLMISLKSIRLVAPDVWVLHGTDTPGSSTPNRFAFVRFRNNSFTSALVTNPEFLTNAMFALLN